MILIIVIIISCHLLSTTLRVIVSSVNNISDVGTSKDIFEKPFLLFRVTLAGGTLNCFIKLCLLGISMSVFFHFCLAAVSVSPLGIKQEGFLLL